MKFLKRLIITLFVIALLLVVAIIVLGVIAYDGSGLSYNPNSSNNMYNLIGSEFGKSLDKIYNSSYVVNIWTLPPQSPRTFSLIIIPADKS